MWSKKTSSSILAWESPDFKNCDEESSITVAHRLQLKVNCKQKFRVPGQLSFTNVMNVGVRDNSDQI